MYVILSLLFHRSNKYPAWSFPETNRPSRGLGTAGYVRCSYKPDDGKTDKLTAERLPAAKRKQITVAGGLKLEKRPWIYRVRYILAGDVVHAVVHARCDVCTGVGNSDESNLVCVSDIELLVNAHVVLRDLCVVRNKNFV